MFERGKGEKDAFREEKGGRRANREYRDEMLAEMEKKVMMVVSFLCYESELTLLEVRQ